MLEQGRQWRGARALARGGGNIGLFMGSDYCVCVAGVSGSRLGMEQVGEPERACEKRGSGRERSGPALQTQMDKLAGPPLYAFN